MQALGADRTVLIKTATLERIRAGEVTLAFRRWTAPRVRAGGTLRTAVGVLSIDAVTPCDPAALTDAEARRAGYATAAALRAELDRRREGSVYRIALSYAGADPRAALRADDALDDAAFDELRRRVEGLDARSRGPAWAMASLRLIGARDGITAAEIAARLGQDKPALKAKIRRLKELGLTESLARGYRLSPRGRAFLGRVTDRGAPTPQPSPSPSR